MTMSSPESLPRPRLSKKAGIRKRRILKYLPFVFSTLILLAVILFNILGYMDRPRQDTVVTANIESRGGEVVKIVHHPGRGQAGYVEAIFDGKQTRCNLYNLKQETGSLDCDPAINR